MNTGSLIFFANYIPSNFNKKLSCFFNFEKTGNNIISNIGKDKNIITGHILPSTGTFWTKKENVGFISGNYIKLENIENSFFNFKNFTCILSVEKASFDGGVLLSSLERTTGLFLNENNNYINKEYYKGFEFGITANNYLYFEYFKNDSPACIVGQNKVNDKAAIYLSINNNIINYGFIDFSKKVLVNSNSIIFSDYLFDQKNLYIGYNPKASGLYSNNKNYIGFIEDLIISSPYLIEYEILNIASGFIYDFKSSSSYVYSSITTGITGTYSTITGYNTEITGYERIPTGIFTNPWGISVMGYTTQPLIRQTPLSGTFNLSGEIINILTGYSGIEFNTNNEKFLSYQTNVINIINKIDNQDYIEAKFLTNYNNNSFNKLNIFSNYDRVSNSYSNFDYPFYNMFVNGQLQRSGNVFFSTLPYETNKLIIENDFGVDPRNKNRIIFNNFYGLAGESSVFIDISKSGHIFFENIENSGGYINLIEGYDFFINGQKLISGIDYNFNTNNIYFNNEYSGILIAVPKNFEFNNITSGKAILSFDNNFYQNNSEVYVNGVRQTLNYDYLELSKFDVTTGIKILLENNKDYIYNNEGFIK